MHKETIDSYTLTQKKRLVQGDAKMTLVQGDAVKKQYTCIGWGKKHLYRVMQKCLTYRVRQKTTTYLYRVYIVFSASPCTSVIFSTLCYTRMLFTASSYTSLSFFSASPCTIVVFLHLYMYVIFCMYLYIHVFFSTSPCRSLSSASPCTKVFCRFSCVLRCWLWWQRSHHFLLCVLFVRFYNKYNKIISLVDMW